MNLAKVRAWLNSKQGQVQLFMVNQVVMAGLLVYAIVGSSIEKGAFPPKDPTGNGKLIVSLLLIWSISAVVAGVAILVGKRWAWWLEALVAMPLLGIQVWLVCAKAKPDVLSVFGTVMGVTFSLVLLSGISKCVARAREGT